MVHKIGRSIIMTTEQDKVLVLSGTILSDRVDEVISNIRPSPESVARRHGVQEYVRQIIGRCFHPDQVWSQRLQQLVATRRLMH